MNKFALIIIVGTILAIVGGAILFTKKDSPTVNLAKPVNYEFFVGDGCPHCKNVEDFLSTWDKRDKVTIDTKEVWYNRDNAQAMLQRAKDICKLPTSGLAVPLLVTPDEKCLTGDEPIISYFKNLTFE